MEFVNSVLTGESGHNYVRRVRPLRQAKLLRAQKALNESPNDPVLKERRNTWKRLLNELNEIERTELMQLDGGRRRTRRASRRRRSTLKRRS